MAQHGSSHDHIKWWHRLEVPDGLLLFSCVNSGILQGLLLGLSYSISMIWMRDRIWITFKEPNDLLFFLLLTSLLQIKLTITLPKQFTSDHSENTLIHLSQTEQVTLHLSTPTSINQSSTQSFNPNIPLPVTISIHVTLPSNLVLSVDLIIRLHVVSSTPIINNCEEQMVQCGFLRYVINHIPLVTYLLSFPTS